MSEPTGVQALDVARIVPGDNDRKTFDQTALQELADSIAEHGLAQPITVRPIWICEICGARSVQTGFCPHGTPVLRFEIVAGERRFRAVRDILQRDTIDGIVRRLNDEQADGIMLAENVQRQDLNPIEEAHAYQKRINRHGWSVAETARQAGVSQGKVKGRLDLLSLVPEIQHLVATREIPISFGERMSVLDTNRQRILIARLRDLPSLPTQRVLGGMVSELYEQQVQDAMFDMSLLLEPQVVQAMEDSESGRLVDILPLRQGLPDLPTQLGGLGRILDEYIALLLQGDHTEEARVLIDFWAKVMRANYCTVTPLESKTLHTLVTKGKLPLA